MKENLIDIILSDKYEPLPDAYSKELFLSVTKEELDTLIGICQRNKSCIQIVYDFSEEEN